MPEITAGETKAVPMLHHCREREVVDDVVGKGPWPTLPLTVRAKLTSGKTPVW